MKIPFRQGVVQLNTKLGNQVALIPNGTNIHLYARDVPLVVTIAHKAVDYLITINTDIQSAWSGVPLSGVSYLFIELDPLTGVRSYGFTQHAPLHGSSRPASAKLGQTWYDVVNNQQFKASVDLPIVQWTPVIRVYVAKYTQGAIHPLGNNAQSFVGSQVDQIGQTNAFPIVMDAMGKPVRLPDGTFVTTGTKLATTERVSDIRSSDVSLRFIAAENIPKYTGVLISNMNSVSIANKVTGDVVAGIVTEDALIGDVVNVVFNDFIECSNWMWSAPNLLVYVDDGGAITDSPTSSGNKPIGVTINERTIFIFGPSMTKDGAIAYLPGGEEGMYLRKTGYGSTDYVWATMSGRFFADWGDRDEPGVCFKNDTNTGVFRASGGGIGVTVDGTEVGAFQPDGRGFKTEFEITAPNFRGLADRASKFENARTVTFTGDATGSYQFDGTEDSSVELTVHDDTHDHKTSISGTSSAWTNGITLTLDGDVAGSVEFDGTGDVTLTVDVKDDTHDHTSITGNAGSSSKWDHSINVTSTGDVLGQYSFDGTMDVGVTYTLKDVIPAGTATKVVFDSKGRIIDTKLLVPGDIPDLDWSIITTGKPTTVAGYGITDAYTKTEISQLREDDRTTTTNALALKADKATTYTKTEVDGFRTEDQTTTTNALALKADKATTYTKIDVDNIIIRERDATNESLALKADKATTYTKTEIDGFRAEDQTDLVDALALKADKATTYTKTEVYNKGEVDQRIQNVIGAAPAALDTLKELADALGNDANFAADVTNSLALKADKATTYTKTEVDGFRTEDQTTTTNALALKADKATTYTKLDVDGFRSADQTTTTNALALKADKATTYTKSEVDGFRSADQTTTTNALALKADKATTYTKLDVDGFRSADQTTTTNALALKADKATTYTKSEVDNHIAVVNEAMTLKADKTTTYTKTDVDSLLGTKVSKAGDTMDGYLDFTANGGITKTTAAGVARWLQQDGTGRQHWYWGTTGGMTPTFTKADEDACDLLMHVNSGWDNPGAAGGGLMQFRSASGAGKNVGDAVNWTIVLHADQNTFQWMGNTVLTSANVGSGNGLDADTVDGKHASDFANAVHGHMVNVPNNTTYLPTNFSANNIYGTNYYNGQDTPDSNKNFWIGWTVRSSINSAAQMIVNWDANGTKVPQRVNVRVADDNASAVWTNWRELAWADEIDALVSKKVHNATVSGLAANATSTINLATVFGSSVDPVKVSVFTKVIRPSDGAYVSGDATVLWSINPTTKILTVQNLYTQPLTIMLTVEYN